MPTLITAGFKKGQKVRALDYVTGQWLHAHIREFIGECGVILDWVDARAIRTTSMHLPQAIVERHPRDWPIQPEAVPTDRRPAVPTSRSMAIIYSDLHIGLMKSSRARDDEVNLICSLCIC
jgi:hypothetical protein